MLVGKMLTMICESCGYSDRHYLPAEQMGWNFVCPSCKDGIYVIARMARSFRGYTFQPFTTEQITGEPVDVESPGQRDALLAKHGLTMDRISLQDQVTNRKRLVRESRLRLSLDILREEHSRMVG